MSLGLLISWPLNSKVVGVSKAPNMNGHMLKMMMENQSSGSVLALGLRVYRRSVVTTKPSHTTPYNITTIPKTNAPMMIMATSLA